MAAVSSLSIVDTLPDARFGATAEAESERVRFVDIDKAGVYIYIHRHAIFKSTVQLHLGAARTCMRIMRHKQRTNVPLKLGSKY
jgi:hypothetical protein